ncbi:hypothetical protein Scep_012888 [Stephania cephalantha]|uniref:Rhamnogalacturonan lyase domain-containing protein n=1 Tax=Stephania cephalantha TaxID=152367 RepID=A0AAP0PA01_9MAGN
MRVRRDRENLNMVTLDNGLVKLTISRPAEGSLTVIQYGGMDNLLDVKSSQDSRGFILRSGVSGFYCYSIFELPTGSPALDLVQTRMVFTLRRDRVTDIQLGHLIYVPPRNGPTIWEIGYPDRNRSRYRRYGFWGRYTDLHTQSDLVFTIGVDDLKKDWFLVQVGKGGTEKYVPTTWEIKFNLGSLTSGSYTLRMALASATKSDIHAYANNLEGNHLVFQVLNLGMDNAVYRHGIHGLYRLFDIEIFSTQYSSHRPGEDMLFVDFL